MGGKKPMSSSASRGGHSTSAVSLASRGGRNGQRQKHNKPQASAGISAHQHGQGGDGDSQPFSLFSASPWVLKPASSSVESLNAVGSALDNSSSAATGGFFENNSASDSIHIELLGRSAVSHGQDENREENYIEEKGSSSTIAVGNLHGQFQSNDSLITLTEISMNNSRNKYNDGTYWIIEDLQDEVKKMNTKIDQLIKENKDSRIGERMSTLEGRQSSIQSKMSILDACFGSNSGLWSKNLKPLKALLESAKCPNQQQQRNSTTNSAATTTEGTTSSISPTVLTPDNHKAPNNPKASSSTTPSSTSTSMSILSPNGLCDGNDHSSLTNTSTTKTLSDVLESSIPSKEPSESSQGPSELDNFVKANFVSNSELGEKLAKISSTINVKMKQMSETINSVQKQINEIQKSMGNLEGKMSVFRSDLKYAVNERKGHAKSHQLSLKRVGKHSYVLEASSENELLMKANAENELLTETLKKMSEKLGLMQPNYPTEDSKLDLKEIGEHMYVLIQSEPTTAVAVSSPYVGMQSPLGQAIDAYKDHMSPYQSYYQQMDHDNYPLQAYSHANANSAYNPYSNYSKYGPYFSQQQQRTPDRHKKRWPKEVSND